MAATGLLRTFAEAGMIHVADFHLARRMAAYFGESDDRVLLALALTVRELRLGSVCLDLACAPELIVPGETDDGSVAEPVEMNNVYTVPVYDQIRRELATELYRQLRERGDHSFAKWMAAMTDFDIPLINTARSDLDKVLSD